MVPDPVGLLLPFLLAYDTQVVRNLAVAVLVKASEHSHAYDCPDNKQEFHFQSPVVLTDFAASSVVARSMGRASLRRSGRRSGTPFRTC
jgi:hypothetical protein